MKCYICDSDNWHVRKDLNPKKDIGICKECGNIAFIIQPEEEQALIDFYRKDYRTKPNNMSIITTTNKLNYIKIFLKDWLQDKKDLICTDIGAATGYVPNWLRFLGHKATGCEYTINYRRFSEHFYGIPLTEEIETKHKYNLITIYHVLEHIVNPKQKLDKFISCMNDNGIIMISVPEWLYICENLAMIGNFTIENYFHENHINCFTRNSFNNLMNVCGLEFIKQDFEQYGITVLVRKGKVTPIIKENWEEVSAKIDKIKAAIQLYQTNKFKDAVEICPLFPEAHLRLIFDLYRKDPSRQEAYFDTITKLMPNNLQIKQAKAVWLYQFEKYDESLKLFTELLQIKPSDEICMHIGYILEKTGKPLEALKMFSNCMNINPRRWVECMDILCSISSKIPAWDERASEQIKNDFFKQVKDHVKIKDPRMEAENEPIKN